VAPWAAMVGGGLVAGTGAGIGVVRRCGLPPDWAERTPAWLHHALVAAGLAVSGLVTVGGLVLALGVVLRADVVTASFAALAPDGGSAVGVRPCSRWPTSRTRLIAATGWALGPGVAVGTATASPFVTAPAEPASFPLLAVLPDSAPLWAIAVLVLPVAVGVLTGLRCLRAAPVDRLPRPSAPPVLTAVAMAARPPWPAGGMAAGPYDPVDVPAGPVAAAVLLWVGVPALVVFLAAGGGAASRSSTPGNRPRTTRSRPPTRTRRRRTGRTGRTSPRRRTGTTTRRGRAECPDGRGPPDRARRDRRGSGGHRAGARTPEEERAERAAKRAARAAAGRRPRAPTPLRRPRRPTEPTARPRRRPCRRRRGPAAHTVAELVASGRSRRPGGRTRRGGRRARPVGRTPVGVIAPAGSGAPSRTPAGLRWGHPARRTTDRRSPARSSMGVVGPPAVRADHRPAPPRLDASSCRPPSRRSRCRPARPPLPGRPPGHREGGGAGLGFGGRCCRRCWTPRPSRATRPSGRRGRRPGRHRGLRPAERAGADVRRARATTPTGDVGRRDHARSPGTGPTWWSAPVHEDPRAGSWPASAARCSTPIPRCCRLPRASTPWRTRSPRRQKVTGATGPPGRRRRGHRPGAGPDARRGRARRHRRALHERIKIEERRLLAHRRRAGPARGHRDRTRGGHSRERACERTSNTAPVREASTERSEGVR
jgi:hypothetical protein